MADFNQPVLSSLYSDMLNILKERDKEALIWMEGSANTNLPLNAKRWNSSNNYFEKFNGTSWVALTTKYNIDVEKIDGCTVNDLGTAVTDLWTASKIGTELSAKLNSSSYTANDILTKLKTVDGASSGLDADLLDGLHASSTNAVNSIVSRDASGNFSAGTITATLSGNASSATTLPGLTATVAELNFVDGVTSNVQTQLNAKLGSTAKAADSALLNGVAEATTATANTIVKRDASGYIYTAALNSTLGDTTTAATHYYCETGSDGWLRPKPIANVKAEIGASLALSGTPTAPTAATATNNTQIATTAFVQAQKVSPALTGVPTAPTAAVGTNNTQIATTAFVQANKPTINASTVASATAGIGYTAVGSYVFASTIVLVNPNGTTAGRNLLASGISNSSYSRLAEKGPALTGTWRAMGFGYYVTGNDSPNISSATLWLRIA